MRDEKFATAATPTTILPLESGDRLTRVEFERRYQAMPDLKKAELIEGVVYVPSPVRSTSHAKPHGFMMTWLGVCAAHTPGVTSNDNATVRLDMDNEPQPPHAAAGRGQAKNRAGFTGE